MKYLKREESTLVAEIIKPADLEKLKKLFPTLWTPVPITEEERELDELARLMRTRPRGGGWRG